MSVYRCPVCGGRGFVPCGFYSSQTNDGSSVTHHTSSEVCRSCNGRGIVFDEFLGTASISDNAFSNNCELCMIYTSYPPEYKS